LCLKRKRSDCRRWRAAARDARSLRRKGATPALVVLRRD
jgi:hypothetical protein